MRSEAEIQLAISNIKARIGNREINSMSESIAVVMLVATLLCLEWVMGGKSFWDKDIVEDGITSTNSTPI